MNGLTHLGPLGQMERFQSGGTKTCKQNKAVVQDLATETDVYIQIPLPQLNSLDNLGQ